MMSENEFDKFCSVLDSVCSLLSRGAYVPTATNSALWFRALRKYPFDVVSQAFDDHVSDPKRGMFVPNPADVIAQIQGQAKDDGRPGADEAWSMSIAARDERDTVVWTDEMAQAWSTAGPVMAMGDETGARMAYRQAYDRLVGEARKAGTAPKWQVSLGHDAERRRQPVSAAVAAGRLPKSELLALPETRSRDVPLLGSNAPGTNAKLRQALRDVADRMRTQAADGESVVEAEAERIALVKANTARLVAAYVAAEKLQ